MRGLFRRATEQRIMTPEQFCLLIAEKVLPEFGYDDAINLCKGLMNPGQKERCDRWTRIKQLIEGSDLLLKN